MDNSMEDFILVGLRWWDILRKATSQISHCTVLGLWECLET